MADSWPQGRAGPAQSSRGTAAADTSSRAPSGPRSGAAAPPSASQSPCAAQRSPAPGPHAPRGACQPSESASSGSSERQPGFSLSFEPSCPRPRGSRGPGSPGPPLSAGGPALRGSHVAAPQPTHGGEPAGWGRGAGAEPPSRVLGSSSGRVSAASPRPGAGPRRWRTPPGRGDTGHLLPAPPGGARGRDRGGSLRGRGRPGLFSRGVARPEGGGGGVTQGEFWGGGPGRLGWRSPRERPVTQGRASAEPGRPSRVPLRPWGGSVCFFRAEAAPHQRPRCF